jgi:hypothetical protein
MVAGRDNFCVCLVIRHRNKVGFLLGLFEFKVAIRSLD